MALRVMVANRIRYALTPVPSAITRRAGVARVCRGDGSMNLWLRLSATFHEHPKMLAVRRASGSRADSAELGWYRLLMAAKRYGRWSFASEDHLAHVAGAYYRFVSIYREAGLLDGLTIHDGETYNAIKTPAERKADQRDRESHGDVTPVSDVARDELVTLDEKERVETKSTDTHIAREGLPNLTPEAVAALELRTGRTWSQAGQRQLSEYDRLIEDHGLTNVCVAMDALREGKPMTARQLVWGAMKVLEPMLSPRVVVDAERTDQTERDSWKGIDATQRYLRELRGESA